MEGADGALATVAAADSKSDFLQFSILVFKTLFDCIVPDVFFMHVQFEFC